MVYRGRGRAFGGLVFALNCDTDPATGNGDARAAET